MDKQLPDDYFLDVDNEMLAYLESQGHSALKETSEANSKLREKAFKIIDILIVGIGAGLMLIFTGQKNIALNLALMGFVLSWSAITIYLALSFVSPLTRAAVFNSPAFLYNHSFKMANLQNKTLTLRKYELHNMTITIHELGVLNGKLCSKMNRAILSIALSPLLFVLVFNIISYI